MADRKMGYLGKQARGTALFADKGWERSQSKKLTSIG